jgi:thiosulfate/3-mercaptopyruvate sulfurtransferase
MSFDTIISCEELNKNITRKDWVIVDCRFDLTAPEWGQEEYEQLHIPGAIYANTDKDLSGKKTPQTGRHPLPEPADFCSAMSRLGIDKQTQVIVYDATSGSFAARLWFLLRFYGHFQVALLDGGFSQWHKEGYPIESGFRENSPRSFTGTPNLGMIVTTPEIEKVHNQPDWLLIDARSAERFRGEQETIDPVAGHIPGAVNRFHGLNVDGNGLFLSKDRLQSEFTELIIGYDPSKTVVYCGSGVTSCHHLVAMAYAGLPQPKLYAGSWSEWIRNTALPIAR